MSNHYDKIMKEIMDSIYMSLSNKFIDNNYLNAEELSTDLHITKEKKTDFLRKFLYQNSEDNFVLHVEAQSRDDPNMLYRMMEYHGMLVRKHKMRVIQMVFYLGRGKSKMKNLYHDGTNTFSYKLINIQDFSYKIFLETDRAEELVLTILSDFEDKSKEEIADLIFSKAKSILNETNLMEKFVNQVGVLSKLRNLDGFIQQFTQNIMALDIKLEDLFTFKQGEIKGKIEGERKNRDKMILTMLKKKKLSIDEIAEIAEVPVEYVKEIMKQS